MRRTKIVATIGPASRDPEVLVKMVAAGMDVARLNFSHGTAEDHAEVADRVRTAAERAGRAVAIMQDLPGPKLRIGKLRDDVVDLGAGDDVTFVCGDGDGGGDGDRHRMFIAWDGLAEAVHPDEIMYLADGSVRLRVTATRPESGEIDTVVEIGGAVASRQGLNIPGEAASLPAVPQEDLEHLAVGERIGVDLVALSFVRRAEDVEFVRGHTRLPLIAKIEKPQAVQRAEEIVRAADCVMVARGDLGIEMRIEEVPIVQKQVIALAGALARPSITATQMLDSMVSSSRPTRAEVADVANAILDGTDAVMLSQESAVGHYPVADDRDDGRDRRAHRALRALPRVAGAARAARPPRPRLHDRLHGLPRRLRARPRRADRADAVGPLRAPDLRAPPDRADLRALARPRDRAPLRADVGRAGGLDAPLRGHRGPRPRRGRARGRARLGQARRARRDHRGPAVGPAGDDEPAPGDGRLTSRRSSARPTTAITTSTAAATIASGESQSPNEPPSAV